MPKHTHIPTNIHTERERERRARVVEEEEFE